MAIQFLNQVSADNNVSIAGNLQVASYIHSDSYLEGTQLQLYTGSTSNKFLSCFESSSQTFINTGTSGETIYFGAPALNTTNIDVQGSISCDGTATIGSISNASSDTDKFLISDGGVIKYRTGAEVRSDIGAGTGTVTGTGSSGRVAVWSGSSSLTSDSELYFDTTNNRLGIGVTSSPQSPLHVKSTATDDIVRIVGASGGKPQINIYEGTNNVGRLTCTGSAAFNISNENSGTIGFFTGSNERITIASGGNVGIATTNPLSTLHVNGAARANSYSVAGTASIFSYSSQLVITNSGNPLYLGGGPGSVAMNVLIPNGNLSITGTTTTDNLNIGQNGTLDAENSSEILIGSGTEIQIDGDAGTAGQYIKSTGNAVEWGTLPDTTKTQTILFSNFIDTTSTTTALRMPFNTLSETTSNQYYNYFDVPANGTIKRVRMQNTSGSASSSFTTTVVIWKNSSGGSPSYTSSAQTISNSEIEVSPNLSISKGDKVQIGYAKSAGSKYWQGVSASVIIEFTKV